MSTKTRQLTGFLSRLTRHTSASQLLFTGGLLLFGLGYLVVAHPLGLWSGPGRPGPGMVPLFAGVALLVMATYVLVKQLRGKVTIKAAAGSMGSQITRQDRKTTILATVFAAGYMLLMPILGIWEATVVYCIASAIKLNATGRVKAALATLVVPVAMLAVFDFAFHLPFPQGILFS